MINIVVEGESDREAAKGVVRAAGRDVQRVVVANGTGRLDSRIPNYNRAAVRMPWVVFRDADSACPVELVTRLSGGIISWSPLFSLRIARSMTEAWLLADRNAFADYFSISLSRIPVDPESLPHAKRTLLALCEKSRSRVIRNDVTAAGGQIGPLYVQRINEYARQSWRPLEAASESDSLQRAIARVSELPTA